VSAVTGPVAFVLKGYPRLSETFIAQEIRALEECGLDIRIISLRHPTDPATHPVHREIRAPVLYLPEYLYQEPRRVWRGWRIARRLPGYRAARREWLADLIRDRTPNRIRRFGQALVLTAEAPETISRFHAHFMHTPGSVARYAATMRGRPFSMSAHAKDIWTIPTWEKQEKLAAADWAVTCTAGHRDHLAELTEPGKVALSYHGLNLDRFPPRPEPRAPKDGSDAFNPIVILSVGRAVEKKGFDVLLRALARVPSTVHWRFIHVGGGALATSLHGMSKDLHIGDRVDFRGALPQESVLELYREADLFVLASRVTQSGDRDGLPNVLMEAQSQGLACIASDTAAIPELIVDRETGHLVPPDHPQALADMITALCGDPALRAQLGAAGEQRVRRKFGMDPGLTVLADHFGVRHRTAAA
jgi:glycosyltransferase involved in cell wall biosynthesis